MNKVIIMGRLTSDPEYRNGNTPVAHYRLAVDRRSKDGGADYINIAAFGKAADFVARYFVQGMRVLVTGHIQTGSYTNRDGQKVYTFDVIAEDQEFADSKRQESNNSNNDYGEW